MQSLLPNIKENIKLSDHTTFRIGGPAKYFLAVKNKEELIETISWAKTNSTPFFILGGGSNILFADKGYEGLIIKMESEKLIFGPEEDFEINCGAGVPLAEIVFETTSRGWGGLEWALGIPGTLGGAVCGNAGRLGQDLAQAVLSVRILDAGLEEKEILSGDCQFSYRDSRFKHNQEIILGAKLKFTKQNKSKAEELLREAQKIIEKMPNFPSAGSVFKNCIVDASILPAGTAPSWPATPALRLAPDSYPLSSMADTNQGSSRRPSLAASAGDSLLIRHPELKDHVRGGKLPAGFLIQQCGLAGRQIGGAQVWSSHGNFILNVDRAKASDVLELIELCKKSVEEKFGVQLEEEIRKVGF